MLLIEVILTAVAWKRGWRGWALVPPVIVFGHVFLLSLLFAKSGVSLEGSGLIPMLDLLFIISQFAMITHPLGTLPRTMIRPVQLGEAR